MTNLTPNTAQNLRSEDTASSQRDSGVYEKQIVAKPAFIASASRNLTRERSMAEARNYQQQQQQALRR